MAGSSLESRFWGEFLPSFPNRDTSLEWVPHVYSGVSRAESDLFVRVSLVKDAAIMENT